MGVEFGEVHRETFRRRVRDGLAACPRLGEADIACCLACGQLVRLGQLDGMAWGA